MTPQPEPAPWQTHAACRGANPDLFFPARGEPTGPARRICITCPVADQCLEQALADSEKHGIWGGMTERQRRRIRRERDWPCGTRQAYANGCRCRACTDAHTNHVWAVDILQLKDIRGRATRNATYGGRPTP